MKEKTTLLLPLFKAGHHHGDGDDDDDDGDGDDADDDDDDDYDDGELPTPQLHTRPPDV